MLRRGEEKIPLAVYKLKTYLAVFWLTFQPKDGWFSWLLFYHCMFIRHPLKLECLSQHGGKFRKLYLEAQSNSESTFGVLHQMLEFFISQVKVDTSRHRIYFRWHYVLISPFAFLIAFCSSEFFLLPSPAQTARAAVLSHCWSSFSQKAPQRVTLSNLLLQPGLNAVSEQADGRLFLNKVWKSTAAETDSSQMLYSSPAGTFLSLGLVEFSLTETCACSLLSSHCNMVQTLSPL